MTIRHCAIRTSKPHVWDGDVCHRSRLFLCAGINIAVRCGNPRRPYQTSPASAESPKVQAIQPSGQYIFGTNITCEHPIRTRTLEAKWNVILSSVVPSSKSVSWADTGRQNHQHAGPKLSGYATSTASRATVIQTAEVDGGLRSGGISNLHSFQCERTLNSNVRLKRAISRISRNDWPAISRVSLPRQGCD